MLSEKEREEMLRLAASSTLRDDMAYLATHRYNPLLVNGMVDMDRLLVFLNEFNEFINHEPKPFSPMIDKDMRL